MKSLSQNWLYPTAGLIVAAVAYFVDDVRGLTGATAAWLLCGVPIVAARVADAAGLRKNSINRGLIGLPPGMLLRAAWTLCGAVAVYYTAREWVGTGFWLATLVFYQVALALQTRHWLRHRRP